MKKIPLILSILVVVFFSCEKSKNEKLLFVSEITDSSSFDEDIVFMDSLHQEIIDMAGAFDCIIASAWRFTEIGAKACGGPTGYIAYSNQINTVVFLEKVNIYTEQQVIFNNKWGIMSDCSIPPRPQEIVCVGGKPEFIY